MSEQLIKTPGVFGDNDNFLLERELGAGGMGGVYMGRDKMLDRPIAVKVMLPEFGSDPEFVDKFKKEAQAAARLIHPNIVQVYSYGICKGMPYMALELASGGSLYGLMKANPGKTDIQRVLKICQQTAQALQCAADQGVVHGDVKPENVLLDANGNAKLVDFGLAAMQKDTEEIWGTPYYISPEKVKKEPIDFRADMYSLGGTLYHALTGVPPFEGDDAIAVVKRRFEGIPKKPSEIRPDVTPAIDKLVMTMLAFKKEDRYPSFEALIEAFKETLTTGLTQKIPTKEGESGSKTASAPTTKRMTVKGRRVSMMKKKTAPGDEAKPEGATDEAKKPVDDSEEGGNIGKKAAISVGIGIAVIGAIVGFLFWYTSHTKAVEAEQQQAAIVSSCKELRGAIEKYRAKACEYIEERTNDFASIEADCEKYTSEFKKLYPDHAELFKPTEGVELTAEQKQSVPGEVIRMREYWGVAFGCRDALTTLTEETTAILAKCDEAVAFGANTSESAEGLKKINEDISKLFNDMSNGKNHTMLKEKKKDLPRNCETQLDSAKKRLDRDRKEAEREKKKAEFAAAKQKEKEEKEAKRKALIEEETTRVRARFSAMADEHADGVFGRLDWSDAERQITRISADYKSEEGRQAAKYELRKIAQMKSVQDIFIKYAKGHKFTSKGKTNSLQNFEITAIDKDKIVVKNGKNTKSIPWPKFYKDYPASFNELIVKFIEKDRQTTKRLDMTQWRDAMAGAAMTLNIVCHGNSSAQSKAAKLAKDVVKEEPDFLDSMKRLFPDVDFEASED